MPIGFDEDSAYLGGFARRLVDAVLAVPATVRCIRDIESFRYATLLCLLRCAHLRLISVWHPSFLLLLLDALPQHWEAILRDIAQGTVAPPVSLPDDVHKVLCGSPDPRRATELERIDPHDPSRIWPDLRLISCWGDGHARTCVPSLRQRFPAVAIQPKGIIATEAFVSLPFGGRHPVAVSSHFFEFLEAGGDARLLHQIEKGGVYNLVVTTGGGLYRYQMHDRIRVTDVVDRTPGIEFVGKDDCVCDLFGEKLSDGFVGDALDRIWKRLGLTPSLAMLAPDEVSGQSCYTLFIELAGPLPGCLAEAVEQELRANPNYDYCVRLGQLASARVFRIGEGGYEMYVRRCMQSGQRIGNVKPAALSRLSGWSTTFHGRHET